MTRIADRTPPAQTAPAPADTSLAEQQHIAFDGVSWELYELLLKDIGDRPIRVTYYRGSIEIMSPIPKHDKARWWIGRLIDMMCLELEVPVEGLGSTTFRKRTTEAGLEPDTCYYVQNAATVRGKDRLDLSVDPPPDLAIEIDITRRSIKKQPVYAALGVPELWRWDGKSLSVLLLRDGRYATSVASAAFPFLPVAQFERYIHRLAAGEEDLSVLRDFQRWVRTLPR
jgi:Uma2 family endonuclease